jgi:hypothetical protein
MIRLAAILSLLLAIPANAQTQKYCARFYDGGLACGIPSMAMCQQALSGVGGSCEEDHTDEVPKNLMQRLMEARDDRPPAVRDLQAVPPPPVR